MLAAVLATDIRCGVPFLYPGTGGGQCDLDVTHKTTLEGTGCPSTAAQTNETGLYKLMVIT